MNQRFTYSIPAHTPSFPATPDRIFVSEPRPYTYGVRHLPCGPLATEPCRPTACNPPGLPTPTTNYSLLTANSSYTFSAKEKDFETGLSYFGSRYYSGDLSIWLSVDPMSDKYASLSPYVYSANNPVMLFDPNGQKSWPIVSKYQNGIRCIISGMKRNSDGTNHGGLDIVHRSPKGNLSGGTITATHDGYVTQAGHSTTAGNWIQITNGDIRTTYMHMQEVPTQTKGDWVSENDVVGQVGSTGRSYGPHVHYQIEMYNNETKSWEKVNPVMEGYEKVTYDMDVHLMDPQFILTTGMN